MKITEKYYCEDEQAIMDYEYSYPSSLELVDIFKDSLPQIIEDKLKAKEQTDKFLRLKTLISPDGKDNAMNWQRKLETAKSIPITDLYNFQRLRRTGRTQQALCPLHVDKEPSFVIYPDNKFRCFGCGKFGDSIDLIRNLFNFDIRQAVNYLTERTSIAV